jgi:hypothetical protein
MSKDLVKKIKSMLIDSRNGDYWNKIYCRYDCIVYEADKPKTIGWYLEGNETSKRYYSNLIWKEYLGINKRG